MAADNLKQDFDRDGVVVLRGLIDAGTLADWRFDWDVFSRKPRTPGFNPVEVNGPFPATLSDLYRYPPLLDAVCEVFGPDIALYNYRFVVKDEHSRNAVFLHQDTCYHVGWPTKLSAFVALSEVNDGNGPLRFYKGSYQFGYMGDAGELGRAPMPNPWFQPRLAAGDVVLMHSATWHESGELNCGPTRVLADCIFQPANDPSGIELLRGEWRCTPQPWLRSSNLFVRSRTSRLTEMQKKLKDAGIE